MCDFSVIVMFVMFFIGDFSTIMSPTVGESLQYFSTWFYYNPAKIFGSGNFANFATDVFVLIAINVALIVASLIMFKKRDIPV